MKCVSKRLGFRRRASETAGRPPPSCQEITVISRKAFDWQLQSEETIIVIE